MTDEIRVHWALHLIDEEAVPREQILAKHPEQRKAQEAKVIAARAALAAIDLWIADSKKRRRTLDADIAALEAQEKHFEKQSLAVTNQHQFEAIRHEIAAVKAKRDTLETEVLERLDAEERDGIAHAEKAKVLERAESEAGALYAKLDAEAATLRAEIATLDARRAETVAALAPPARTRYERLRQGRGGRAVAAVVHGACGGCHATVAPQVLTEVRRGERLPLCEGCGRLLVMPDMGASSPHGSS